MSATEIPTLHNLHPLNRTYPWKSRDIWNWHKSIPLNDLPHCQQDQIIVNKQKKFSQKYHHSTTRQQYQHRNTGPQYHHGQQYQPISFQRHRKYSIPHLKENCLGFGINNKGVRELIMKHYGTLENTPFIGTLYVHAKAPREQLLQKNHKHVSRPNDFNKNKYA